MKKKIIATISALFMIMTLTGGAVMTTASGHSEKKPVVAASTIPNRDGISTSRSIGRPSLTVSEEMALQRKARQEQPAKIEPKKAKIEAVVRVTPKRTVKPATKTHKHHTTPLRKTYAGSSNSGNPQTYAEEVLGSTQFQCFSNIIERESGWNPYATNPSSGAYGLPQALPGSKMASAGSDWRTNPITQVKWGIHYMNSRYGSPCGAWSYWQGHNYY